MFKRKKSQIILASVAIVLVLGITAFAKQVTETISVMYDNIKILIDGVEYTAKDANGNVIEPFIYNGTTYLPVRGIANAFDVDVNWETQTSTVMLGAKECKFLDQMNYADYFSSNEENRIVNIPVDTRMADDKIVNRGLEIGLNKLNELSDGSYECKQSVSYLLNSKYKNFVGVLAVKEARHYYDATGSGTAGIIRIYGDEKLLYTSPVITIGFKSINFDLNIENIKLLKIEAEIFKPFDKKDNISLCIADSYFYN